MKKNETYEKFTQFLAEKEKHLLGATDRDVQNIIDEFENAEQVDEDLKKKYALVRYRVKKATKDVKVVEELDRLLEELRR